MRRLLVPLVIGPLLAVALAACNGGDVAVVQGQTVSLTLSDYRIAPQRVRVKPGRITFTVRNDAHGAHNWAVRGRGKVRGRIGTLLPGESGTLTVRLKHGTYRMFCSIGHHEELGEYGTVSVR
jgi:plastocyanin